MASYNTLAHMLPTQLLGSRAQEQIPLWRFITQIVRLNFSTKLNALTVCSGHDWLRKDNCLEKVVHLEAATGPTTNEPTKVTMGAIILTHTQSSAMAANGILTIA